MSYLRLLSLILSYVALTTMSFPSVTVSSYDANSAIRVSAASGGINKSSVIATSENNKLDVLGFWFVNSGLNFSDDVVVMRVAFNNFLFDSADGSLSVKDINMLADGEKELKGAPLFYPNPFRFSNINKDTGVAGGTLHYVLSRPMDIEIKMYDIFGRQIWSKVCPENSSCGRANKNMINFNKSELNGFEMSAGVYFYIFVFEGKVIGRGKVAVVP